MLCEIFKDNSNNARLLVTELSSGNIGFTTGFHQEGAGIVLNREETKKLISHLIDQLTQGT